MTHAEAEAKFPRGTLVIFGSDQETIWKVVRHVSPNFLHAYWKTICEFVATGCDKHYNPRPLLPTMHLSPANPLVVLAVVSL